MPVTEQPARRAGRPPNVHGRRVQVYLDATSLAVASRLGNGNISQGIRQALLIQDSPATKPGSLSPRQAR